MNKLQLLQSLKEKGFSKQVIDAFAKIEREKFVPASLRERAYEDNPLPIGKGQTISQPNTTAIMLDLLELKKSQKILFCVQLENVYEGKNFRYQLQKKKNNQSI